MEQWISRIVLLTSLLSLTTQTLLQQHYILEQLTLYYHFKGFQSSTGSNLCPELALMTPNLKLLMEWLFDLSKAMHMDTPCWHSLTLCLSVVDMEMSCTEIMVCFNQY
jgi:hypothetical protein